MSKGRRKNKINKRLRSPATVSSPIKTMETTPLPPHVGKLKPDRTATISREIFIAAPVAPCFNTLARQLEQPPKWDPFIVNVHPVSKARGKIGATSQVTLNLGGKELESLAMISRYRPNRYISWVLNSKPKVREDWRLEPKPHGTMVGVTLVCEIPGWIIERFIYKVMRRKKLEQDLDKMLTQLEKAVKSISREQRLAEKRK